MYAGVTGCSGQLHSLTALYLRCNPKLAPAMSKREKYCTCQNCLLIQPTVLTALSYRISCNLAAQLLYVKLIYKQPDQTCFWISTKRLMWIQLVQHTILFKQTKMPSGFIFPRCFNVRDCCVIPNSI